MKNISDTISTCAYYEFLSSICDDGRFGAKDNLKAIKSDLENIIGRNIRDACYDALLDIIISKSR